MSRTATAKIEAPGARGTAPRALKRGLMHGWSAPGAAGLRVGRPDDPCEAQADHAARRALTAHPGRAAVSLPPAVLKSAPPPAGGAGGLPALIAAAGPEGQALPDAQRAFFEPRFGHRFDGIRVHAGPAAAAATSAVAAQAFTLGPDIYFGNGHYRPDSRAGRELLAHELAHALQDRPNVIARRTLDAPFDLPESNPAEIGGPGASDTDPSADDLAMLVEAGAPQSRTAARDRLGRLDPNARAQLIARLRSRVPAADRDKVDGLGEEPRGPEGEKAPQSRMPELRLGDSPPAPVAERREVPHQPAPLHQRATTAAAARMQEAIREVSGEAPLDRADAQPPAGPDTAGVPEGASAGTAPTSDAAAAAQNVVAVLGQRVAEVEGAASLPVLFRQDAAGPPGDPAAFARVTASQSLAAGFVSRSAERVQAVLSAALAVPGQLLTALGGARQAIAAQAAAQGSVLKDGAEAARKQIRNRASRLRGAIEARRGETDRDLATGVQDARDRATRAHDEAAANLVHRSETEKSRIATGYDNALNPMIAVGVDAGARARGVADARAASLRQSPPKDGESSILDGPIHDDRLDAEADASEKVGEAYDNSFQESARQQADKLPESRPEVLAKVDDITTQARTGFTEQLTGITRGADALESGAKTRSQQAAHQMQAALDAAAKQSGQGIDAAEAQQSAALRAQAEAAQGGLDQAVTGVLSNFGAGVAEAARQLAAAIRSFIASAAGMPAPEPGEVSTALAAADPAAALAAMADQVATVAPTMAGILAEGQQGSDAALAAAATAATQGFTGSAATFAESAAGISRQSATGFARLGAGNKRSAANVAADAEAGFRAAASNADTAYGRFGDTVEENFRTGRAQMFDGLWSRDNQDKLAHDMKEQGEKAADQVKPRWKRVLKWVVTIVVIVAVIAVTVLSAGALGPVGVVLLGAALGAAAGAVQTIADNLIDGEPWSKGVVKAMIVGAVGGALGGAGGVLLKGVGSVGLRIALEGGVNIIGGVAGEAIGSVAVGQSVNWTGALMGALVGAGIGAGLGLAGALRGRIRVGGIGEPAAPPLRPAIEPPPSPPAGRLRSALEAAKILAPRPGPAVPEVAVGAGAAAEPALATPSVEAPPTAAAPSPAAPEAAPPLPRPREPIGFRLPERPSPPVSAPEAAPPLLRPREPIGFRLLERPSPPVSAPEATPPLPRPREPIGFRLPERPPPPVSAPEATPPLPRPREPIGFRPPGQPPSPAAPVSAEPIPATTPADVVSQPRAMMIEPAAPRPVGRNVFEPVRAGGAAPEITAPVGPRPPAGGAVEPIRGGSMAPDIAASGGSRSGRPGPVEPRTGTIAEPGGAALEQGASGRPTGGGRPARALSEPAPVPEQEAAPPAATEPLVEPGNLGTRMSGRPRATPEPDPTPPTREELAAARRLGNAKPPQYSRLGDVWRWLRYRAGGGRIRNFADWLKVSRGSRSGGPNHEAIQDQLVANGGEREVPIGNNAADALWPQGTNGAPRDTYHQIGELNEVRGDPVNRERINLENIFNYFRRRGQDVELWFWDRNNPTAQEPAFKLRTDRPLGEQANWPFRAVRSK